ncbi:hypothetical protein O6H91_07G026400 [Diphasiastrum complanatum]|uniref:Uncharacterized protein n=1 Tax=Diphasiastrum complanatum TaxID=34168 RepID=A0ACC2D3C9_DIPCM|nr:hypothetical protein O6H91_07G026400 [Diphasiastrum complanatum]
MVKMDSKNLESRVQKLCREVRELSLGSNGEIDRLEGPLVPIRFLREYVMPGKPCIITGAVNHWKALQLWSNHYLASVLRDQDVSIYFTPNGFADSVVDLQEMHSQFNCQLEKTENEEDEVSFSKQQINDRCVGNDLTAEEPRFWFVTSHVEKIPFPEALREIVEVNKSGRGVAYAQHQNNCFLSEFGLLASDAEVHIPWATEAFGGLPEAVNLWIGNEKGVTSFHKDHYENMYVMVAGEKHFTLLPPVDVHRLYVRSYPSASFKRSQDGKTFSIEKNLPIAMVPWASVDPYPSALKEEHAIKLFPRYFQGELPFTCTLKAGEILYLLHVDPACGFIM